MTRVLDLPLAERQALIDQVDREVEAMKNGKKEPVLDEKGNQIGTTYFGDGTKLPETIYNAVVIHPEDLMSDK